MTWGGLNNALTAWRNAYNLRLPGRGTASDGARADALHGSKSQHQEDSDGTVDANDMDVNVQGSSNDTGTTTELRIIEAMKLDFEQDPHRRGQLWIHNGEIANKDRDDWAERDYSGTSNPHKRHVHWESDQEHEDDGRTWPMPNTDRVLRELGVGNPQNDDQGEDDEDDMKIDEFFASIGRATSDDPKVQATATATDRANRDNFARAMRFTFGYNAPYDMAKLPAGALGRIATATEAIASGASGE